MRDDEETSPHPNSPIVLVTYIKIVNASMQIAAF